MITTIPFPQKTTQCYTIGATVQGVSDGAGKITFPALELQQMPSDGFLRITRLKLESNLSEDAFANSLALRDNALQMSIRYGTGADNLLFKKPVLLNRFLDLEFCTYYEIAGNDPSFWILPDIQIEEVSTMLAGYGAPRLHCMVTLEQSNNESFNQALREGVI